MPKRIARYRVWYRRHAQMAKCAMWGGLLAIALLLTLHNGRTTLPSTHRNPPDSTLMLRFHRVVNQRLESTARIAQGIVQHINSQNPMGAFLHLERNAAKQLARLNAQVLIAQHDSLILWTFPINTDTWERVESEKPIVWINGIWYYTRADTINGYQLMLLVALRSEYTLSNQYLKAQWDRSLLFLEGHHTPSLALHIPSLATLYAPPSTSPQRNAQPIGYLLFLIALFTAPGIFPASWRHWTTWIVILIAIIARIVTQRLALFSGQLGELFQPRLFAIAPLFHSLGDLILFAITLTGIVHLLASLYKHSTHRCRSTWKIFWIFWALLAVLLMQGIDLIIHHLVINSTISLAPNLLTTHNPYTLLLFSTLALLSSTAILAASLFASTAPYKNPKTTLLVWAIVIAICTTLLELLGLHLSLWGLILSSLLLPSMLLIRKNTPKRTITARWIIIASVLIAIYLSASLQQKTIEKNRLIDERLVETIGTERDLMLELSLRNISFRVKSDSILATLTTPWETNPQALYDYFTHNYLVDYLTGYDCQLTLCFCNTHLLLTQSNALSLCKRFFSGIIQRVGKPIEGSFFHYLNNQNGRISYLGAIPLPGPPDSCATLYVELDSKLPLFFWGYPELLVHGSVSTARPDLDLSTALYHRNTLVARTGQFPYPTRINSHSALLPVQTSALAANYLHGGHTTKNGDFLIISRIIPSPIEFISGTVYLAIILLIIIYAHAYLNRLIPLPNLFAPGLTGRIQRLVFCIMAMVLTMAIISTVYILQKSFKTKRINSLNERILMVHSHIDDWMQNAENPEEQALTFSDWWLTRLSNSLYSDINLYDTDGWLIASSRPEIFNRYLAGRKMHPSAWLSMSGHHNSLHIQEERIGGLEFSSIYAPLTQKGKTVAYINIPHFTQPHLLKRQFLTHIALVINLFLVCLFIAFLLAFTLANRIIKPIQSLCKGVESISFTSPNTPIDYKFHDEVGLLVKAYNGMLTQLQQSAKKLAENERQLAWREMARQIAHDIKNPLTPIKLNLQYLIALREGNDPEWQDKFDSFAKMLQGQIDLLAQTASTFSQFASTPGENTPCISPYPLIEQVIGLHRIHPHIRWTSSIDPSQNISIKIEPSSFQRIISNLVTNAVQAIGSRSDGHIAIRTNVAREFFIVEIQDNGSGIPTEIIGKIFQVSFTTKREGSGLGLAIVKTIVSNAGGDIDFTTEPNVGTTFSLRLPIHANCTTPHATD